MAAKYRIVAPGVVRIKYIDDEYYPRIQDFNRHELIGVIKNNRMYGRNWFTNKEVYEARLSVLQGALKYLEEHTNE